MKKLKLLPKTDTITICLPEDWVGRPITCTLAVHKPKIFDAEVQEEAIHYRVNHRIKKEKLKGKN